MMKHFIYIIFLGLFFNSLPSFAQETDDLVKVMDQYAIVKSERDSLIKKNEELSKEIEQLNTQLKSKSDEGQELQRLKKDNAELLDSIRKMQAHIAYGDNCIGRLANSRLNNRFNKNQVDDAIEGMGRITTPEVIKRFKQVPGLLAIYQSANDSLRTTLQTIQRKTKSEEWSKEWKKAVNLKESAQIAAKRQELKAILTQMSYYKDHYVKKSNDHWTIPYLDRIIEQALDRINKFENDLNFEDLIKQL